MRAAHHIESHEHARRSEREEDRAIHQASEGHYVRAGHLQHKSNEQAFEAVATSNHPVAMAGAVHPGPPIGAAVAATEYREAERMAEYREAERRAEFREAERMAPGPYGRPEVVVVREPGYYPGPPGAGYPAYGFPR